MLEIRKITKVYETGGFKQKALDNVSVNFRKSEFAAILGPSGSGKTTFLNIIGGLDKYTSGDLIINEMSTKKYKDADWDSYRNHRIGFVFQSYNLINHQTILSNVMLALTLSGISKKESMERSKKALKRVGLYDHMMKRPNQLSGGQMQRVAIARALVNDPDILLADEPTGALDSVTSVQIMEILKEISKDKLVIMVTHNPELAKEYASRIITLKDGKITDDTNPYDGKINTSEDDILAKNKTKKTNMSFLTALSLSFNNLMTKKGRTILVAFAGSIGIIGIALILALSNGFQSYVDKIGEDALTSYPLNIMQESTDIANIMLSMRDSNDDETKDEVIKEKQTIASMLKNISTNDLKSFKKYLDNNYEKVENDLSTIKYSYSVNPYIYTIDGSKKLAKLNPSNLFSSMFSGNMMQSMSAYSSIYSQMIDNTKLLNESYEILKGRWPEKYNEMVVVLTDKHSMSDLLVYSLGLRDTEELSMMVSKIMQGERVNLGHSPLTISYDDLLNLDLRLIMPSDLYKYNSKYDVYEDMSNDEGYMKNLYNNAIKLKIVGIVSVKDGVNSMALNPGVNYRRELIDYIINYAKNTDVVKKQLLNEQIDVISGQRFDEDNKVNFNFNDMISVDKNMLQSAFSVKMDNNLINKIMKNYMNEMVNSISTNTNPAKDDLINNFENFLNDLINEMGNNYNLDGVDEIVDSLFLKEENKEIIDRLSKEYQLSSDDLSKIFKGLLKTYLTSYLNNNCSNNSCTSEDVSKILDDIKNNNTSEFNNDPIIMQTIINASNRMTEAKINKIISEKIGGLMNEVMKNMGKSLNVDTKKISQAFKFNMTKEEMARVFQSMMSVEKTNAKSNLIKFGYQDLLDPTYISFYFTSFQGKEHFIEFLDNYNSHMEEIDKDKKLNYSDTTGILISSIKTIVDAVSYILIAFVSISLVVSSIMIGIITYISVFERTKEIGILRSIGASKGNISSIFNAETFIIGLLSGMIGIGVSYILIPIINAIIHHFTGDIPLGAVLQYNNAIILVILSIILTLIGGLIPSRSASKKDPVEALRSE